MVRIQKGGHKLGSGTYGVVYGEPGLPAIDAQGRTPILPPAQYVSKVFLEDNEFDDNQAKQAADEASIKLFFQSQFPDNFDKLKEHFIIPLGDYFIDKNALKKEWATYNNISWLGSAPARNQWLTKALNATPMKSQVVVEVGGINLHQLFTSLPRTRFPKDAIKGIINILEGIEMLRAKNIIHSDIKTPNALDTPSGKFKIIDLGDCTKIDTITPQTLIYKYGDIQKYIYTSGEELGGIVQMIPYTMYFIWPSVVQFFIARSFPKPDGTDGEALTFKQFKNNWQRQSDLKARGGGWNGPFEGTNKDNGQFIKQLELLTDMWRLVEIAKMMDETLFVLPGPYGDAFDAIHVTGRLFLINLMNTCMLEKTTAGNFVRPNKELWFYQNLRWNTASIGSLYQRIDMFSVGVIFINCLHNWARTVYHTKMLVDDATINYLKHVIRLIAQCCYQTPSHIIAINPRLKDVIMGRPIVVAAPARPPTPPNAYAVAVKRAAADTITEAINETLAKGKKGGKRRRTRRKRPRGKRTKRRHRRRKKRTRRRRGRRGGWFGKNWLGTWGQKTKKTRFGWTSKNMKCNPYLPLQCPGGGRCVGTGWAIGPIKLQGKCV